MINSHLRDEIQARLGKAGVQAVEARISHLAYAQKIAQTMLQRQQAGAIIAALTKIVEGAVSMIEMALDQLSKRGVVQLDEERKASMVSNLLVVLCGERGTQPVANTGSLYSGGRRDRMPTEFTQMLTQLFSALLLIVLGFVIRACGPQGFVHGTVDRSKVDEPTRNRAVRMVGNVLLAMAALITGRAVYGHLQG